MVGLRGSLTMKGAMESFFPNQRWTSETEPELGLGIVTQTSKGRVQIHFPTSEETRLYAVESAPLRRVRFKPGDKIVNREGRPLVIEEVREHKNLFFYLGKDGVVTEADLGDVSVKHGADDRLLMGNVDTPQIFSLRRETLEHNYRRQVSSIHGFVGGRIDLIPHQLYIAQEVSSRYAPRVLLSDEVGLGKTIEACLILHRLLLRGRISRVLILVPDSLVHQWFVELLRRFNLWFHIFDEERCLALEESAPDGNPFLDDQLVLCSTDFLAGSLKRAVQAQAASWDMLVVDEAHHLEWSVDQPSRAYMVVEMLSKVAEGLLLLTATPEQLGLESHFARLRLLDPDRYSNYDSFKNESLDHKEAADLVDKLSQAMPLDSNDQGKIESLFGKARLNAINNGNEAAPNHLIQDLLDQHGPGRVVFRNTRAAMKGFPRRKAHLIPLQREEGGDPLLDWLISFMQEIHPEKALLICKSKGKVLALEKALKALISLKVGVFHEDLSLVQRDRNAAWFSEPEGARLLLCSEIGSEGRNFQFAHHLVLFDLPTQPELLEQRIGRLDRIGQTEDIQIHIPYVKGSQEEVLVRWYHEGLNAFEKNLESGNKISQLFGGRLSEIEKSGQFAGSQKELENLIADTKAFHKELNETLAKGRDRLLEMNSFRPAIANKLVDHIKAADQESILELYLMEVFEHYVIEIEDLAPRTYLLHAPQNNPGDFPAISEGGITVTFDRKRSLSREEVTFLSWDHPMITGVIDLILGSETGSASFGILTGSGTPAILLEVIFVLETMGPERKMADRFLPSTPIRVVIDHSGSDVTDQYPSDKMNRRLRPGQIDDLLENETLVEVIIPKMISNATHLAEDIGKKEILKGVSQMNQTMDHEIGRLEILQRKNNHIRPEEIAIALKEQAMLSSLMEGAKVRLDSLQLIQVL